MDDETATIDSNDDIHQEEKSNIAVLIKKTDSMQLCEQFSSDVLQHLEDGNASKLKELYGILSEIEDVGKGKTTCLQLYKKCFKDMTKIIKDDNCERMVKYYVWHFVQLMTCCPQIKDVLFENHDAMNLLLQFHKHEWNEEQISSLKSITLNYILIMLADAQDEYYEFIETTDVIPFLYNTLETCVMNPDDPHFELALLSLNLLLEGSSGCKHKMIQLDFKSLLSRKMETRGDNCHANMLNVTKQTYEKFLLLGSDQKSFVETFRYNAKEELKKDSWFCTRACSNTNGCKFSRELTANVSEMNLKYCSRCRSVTYCSKECQIAHWKESHSKVCKKAP